ncbi:hypothetical protein [Aliamphritea spongicola]|nr:hypothetical protein [Aliamphritea spongicola]
MHRVQQFILCLILSLAWLPAFADTPTQPVEVTIYADDSYPPYSYVENNILKGLYTRILSTAFSRMPDYRVRLMPVPWKRGLMLLEKALASHSTHRIFMSKNVPTSGRILYPWG